MVQSYRQGLTFIVVDCWEKIKCTICLQKIKKSFKILLTFDVGAIMFRQLIVIGLCRVQMIPGIFFAKFHLNWG